MRLAQSAEEAPETEKLGDFTVTARVLWVSALAIVIGILSSFGRPRALPKLIGLFTNLFYYQRWSTALVSSWRIIISETGRCWSP